VKLDAIIPVHNEAWALGLTLRAILEWCDEAVVLLHACVDDSERIALQVAEETKRVRVMWEPSREWQEMPMRQRMLGAAREGGATHIAILDADEILTANLAPDIRMLAEKLQPGNVLDLPGYNLRGGVGQYHSTGVWANRWFASIFRDAPGLGWHGDRFHHRHPMGQDVRMRRMVRHGDGGVMHLWGASERRLRAKHALYKMTEVLRWPSKSKIEIDRMYSLAIHGEWGDTPADWKFAPTPGAWWGGYEPLMKHLDLGAVPLQETECAALIEEHGMEPFKSLNLFGVEKCQQASAVLV
jgi:hypothetical protein